MNILVVAAHPDDEVLGAGGAIAEHSQSGDKVTIAILGEGITSRSATGQRDDQALERLKTDAREAAKIMGAVNVLFFDLPDNRFDGIELLTVVKMVETVVADTAPEIVYTHWSGDLNIDHVITHKAVMTACRPLPGCGVRRILAFEVPSSTEWSPVGRTFSPTVFKNISATLDTKLEAMKAYGGELRDAPHPRSLQSLTFQAGMRGSQAGMTAAEAFVLLREIDG